MAYVQAPNGMRTFNYDPKRFPRANYMSPLHWVASFLIVATGLTDFLYQRDREIIALARPDLAAT
jgi:hypothetical protein